jgi:hypothetical protein
VAARQTAPVIGALCSGSKDGAQVAKPKKGLDITMGYRYQESFRHFIGTVEQKQREILHTQIHNSYHLIDVAANYRLTPRWSISGSAPFLVATRDQLYAPKAIYHVAGIGDVSVGARALLFHPPTENGGNIALGFSFKFPTGNPRAQAHALDSKGREIVAVADQSVQAGDGGYGFSLDMQAYHPGPWKTMGYLAGQYLFNPTDTNGVPTFRTRPGETIMSVSDQYLYRGGVSRAIPHARGLVASFGGRIEGVPVRDAFGPSNGFRRPGYAISIDPGIMWGNQDWTMSMDAPWAVQRNRRASVSDLANHTHGDAAFADYAITVSLTRHF